MRRRDLIPLLLRRAWTLPQLARELRRPPRDLAEDLAHLWRSLPHTGFEADITPARCRKCGFTFGPDKLLKPGKCPHCRGTWIAEPRVAVRARAANPLPADPPDPAPAGFNPAGEFPDWLTLLDHTADAGIRVTAPDLPTLFSRAAWGLFSVITDPATVQPAEAEPVEVTAEDLPALLVRWLSELNYRHLTRHRLYARFDVRELVLPKPAEPGTCRLDAEVRGEAIVPGRHPVFTEIKAVTFHGLELTEIDGGWRAQIIFDL